MGFLIDTSVLICAERGGLNLDQVQLSGEESVAMAAISASELLHGVHRADNPQRRRRRERFVEALLQTIRIVPFDLEVARTHASIWADLAQKGALIGAHDLQIAATAVAHDLHLLTRDRRHFERVEELTVTIW